MIQKLVGIRKLLLTLLVFVTSCLLLVGSIIDPQVWKDLNIVILPAYLTANVIEWFSKKAPNEVQKSS